MFFRYFVLYCKTVCIAPIFAELHRKFRSYARGIVASIRAITAR